MQHALEKKLHSTIEPTPSEETSVSRPNSLEDYVEATLNKHEKRDVLLEKIHKTAADGVILLEALHTQRFADEQDFFCRT
jgi:hypothetical protein